MKRALPRGLMIVAVALALSPLGVACASADAQVPITEAGAIQKFEHVTASRLSPKGDSCRFMLQPDTKYHVSAGWTPWYKWSLDHPKAGNPCAKLVGTGERYERLSDGRLRTHFVVKDQATGEVTYPTITFQSLN